MAKKKPEHPMQPLVRADGVIRFKQNAIVRFLLDWSQERGMGLNELAMMDFSQEDHEQFAQLIGYSVSGFGDLSYVRKKTIRRADEEAERFAAAK